MSVSYLNIGNEFPLLRVAVLLSFTAAVHPPAHMITAASSTTIKQEIQNSLILPAVEPIFSSIRSFPNSKEKEEDR